MVLCSTALGLCSTALGLRSGAELLCSTALGLCSTATGLRSGAELLRSTALGLCSTALGLCSGAELLCSTALGLRSAATVLRSGAELLRSGLRNRGHYRPGAISCVSIKERPPKLTTDFILCNSMFIPVVSYQYICMGINTRTRAIAGLRFSGKGETGLLSELPGHGCGGGKTLTYLIFGSEQRFFDTVVDVVALLVEIDADRHAQEVGR